MSAGNIDSRLSVSNSSDDGVVRRSKRFQIDEIVPSSSESVPDPRSAAEGSLPKLSELEVKDMIDSGGLVSVMIRGSAGAGENEDKLRAMIHVLHRSLVEKTRQIELYELERIRQKRLHKLEMGFCRLYEGLISRLNQIRSVKKEEARGFPSPQVLEEFKESIEDIATACDVAPFGELLPRIFAHGFCARKGSTYIDLIVDIAQRLIDESPEQANRLLSLSLELDPKCFRALCEQWNIDDANLELLKKVIEIGKEMGRDVSKYEYALGERLGPARNLQHALKLAFFQNRDKLRKEHPGAIVEYNTTANEVHVLLPSDELLPQPEILTIDHYPIRIVFLRNKLKPLYARSHSPTLSGGNLIQVQRSDGVWWDGTIGCVVQRVVDDGQCFLSNGHVLSRSYVRFERNTELVHLFVRKMMSTNELG